MNLLPCPFCGHNPSSEHESLRDSVHPVGRSQVWEFNCNESEGGCGAAVLAGSRNDAIKAWNSRADQTSRIAELEAELAALKQSIADAPNCRDQEGG